MKRPDFLEAFARHRGGAPTITGPGLMTRELFAATGEDPTILYNMEMPYATAMCLGLAMARPMQRIVALEGDGSLISALGILTTMARHRQPNLTLIVLDNASYSTFGAGMISATAAGVDLAAVARGCGLDRTLSVTTLAQAETALPRVLREDGPWVLIAKVEPQGEPDPRFARNSPDVMEQALDFARMLRRSAASAGTPRNARPTPPGMSASHRYDVARIFADSLKTNGIALSVMLPDSVLHPLNELLLADATVATVSCSREDEGIAIAAGAGWGGWRSAVSMEGSAIGMSGLILARAAIQRSPTLILASHTTVLGERFGYHAATRAVTQPVLDALRIPYHVLRDADEIPHVVKRIVQTMEGQKIPAAILVPPFILMAD
ncbi:MAG TPA: thiamine pyrophosphate-dependent enzyme [Stellaceae bacterium]|nr:thiamine pyrophosphate-dependent enzyme [Stellaceae bacterium]